MTKNSLPARMLAAGFSPEHVEVSMSRFASEVLPLGFATEERIEEFRSELREALEGAR